VGLTYAYLAATLAGGLLAAYAYLGTTKSRAAHRRLGPSRKADRRARAKEESSKNLVQVTLDATAAHSWICEAARLIDANAHYLTHLDAVIGDADHGTNMRRGFRAVVMALNEVSLGTPGAVLAAAGQAFITKVGGAAGPLYGAGFRCAADALGDTVHASADEFGAALRKALVGIQDLGAATAGDKTMVDAWGPAVAAYERIIASGGDLVQATRAAADAAERGLRATAAMQARKGRASYIGPRTIGHEDPGAASTVLILCALSTTLAGSASQRLAPPPLADGLT
jgi:dihydroxyacetone kinase-like protein